MPALAATEEGRSGWGEDRVFRSHGLNPVLETGVAVVGAPLVRSSVLTMLRFDHSGTDCLWARLWPDNGIHRVDARPALDLRGRRFGQSPAGRTGTGQKMC